MNKFHGVALDDIFGEGHMWEEVQAILMARTTTQWPRMSLADREDAVAAAMLDLVDYWSGLESSRGGSPRRRFNYALYRGTRRANFFLSRKWRHDQGLELIHADGSDEDAEWVWRYVTETLEDQMSAEEARHRVEALIETIPDDEWDSWLRDFVDGVSVTSVARRDGVSHQAVSRRRQRGIERLRQHFTEGE